MDACLENMEATQEESEAMMEADHEKVRSKDGGIPKKD
jgi:hypothetical protein